MIGFADAVAGGGNFIRVEKVDGIFPIAVAVAVAVGSTIYLSSIAFNQQLTNTKPHKIGYILSQQTITVCPKNRQILGVIPFFASSSALGHSVMSVHTPTLLFIVHSSPALNKINNQCDNKCDRSHKKKHRKMENRRKKSTSLERVQIQKFNKYLRSCAHAIVFNANNKKILPYGIRFMTRRALICRCVVYLFFSNIKMYVNTLDLPEIACRHVVINCLPGQSIALNDK